MKFRLSSVPMLAAGGIAFLMAGSHLSLAVAQEQAAVTDAAATEEVAPEPLSDEELQILVARIALYPDELIAVISTSSLYPLQIVEAARFLDQYAKDPNLKPKDSWDGSVISLLNYREIVRMMSDDLDWTQTLGEAVTYQRKDVLIAIQQLRDQAVASGIIKSDDKITVTEDNDNVIIQSASQETIYVPQYAPEMLYTPDYVPVPIGYYPEPYPSYYYPTAPFFAAAVTGAVFAAVVDWDDWDVWGGRWGGDIDVDCNRCFNNVDINGKVKFNDVDWRHVDRSKISIDKNQFTKVDRNSVKASVKANDRNSIRTKATSLKKERPSTVAGKAQTTRDVRKNSVAGLKTQQGGGAKARPDVSKANIKKPEIAKPAVSRTNISKPAQIKRPAGKPKVGGKLDKRPAKPSGLGEVKSGKREAIASKRGGKGMGGGQHGGGRPNKAVKHGGGGRRR